MNRLIRVLDENIRVLPVLILAVGFLVFMKSADLWQSVQQELIGIDVAEASSSAPSNAEEEEHAEEPAADHGPVEATADQAAIARSSYDEWRAGEDDNYLDTAGMGLSLAEIQVLESLSERREALEARESELNMREHLIAAVEQRTEERIEELRTLEANIQGLLMQRDEDEAAQMASLVTVYENMRPKDAAAIFENLDTGILVEVASRMREAKIAPVLAEMEIQAAQELTVMLATRLDIPGME